MSCCLGWQHGMRCDDCPVTAAPVAQEPPAPSNWTVCICGHEETLHDAKAGGCIECRCAAAPGGAQEPADPPRHDCRCQAQRTNEERDTFRCIVFAGHEGVSGHYAHGVSW